MAIKIKQKHEKEIIALDDFEAVRIRPGMYVGPVSLVDEKIPIIRDGKLQNVDKSWSKGFMHMIVEILENGLDEAKRMKGKMKNIHVAINLDDNEITVTDEGGGFHKAHSKHPKTGKNVVRTAMEDLHAGSNFAETESNILGTHGVGSAVVNILSESFSIKTVNRTHFVQFIWNDFKVVKQVIRKKTDDDIIGTSISFKPTKDVFKDFKWDEELVRTYLSFKNYIISNDSNLGDLKIDGSFIRNGVKEPVGIVENFLPDNHILVKSKLGNIIIWRAYEQSTSISFINGSQCTGIHQKIVNDWGNDYFGYNLAHHFYNTFVSLEVPSTLMRFGDQNKSKYDVTRYEIEEIMELNFKAKLLRGLKNSDISKEIESDIEEKLYAENIRKIKKAQRTSKRKISHKYSPASRKKETLYITEGLSAAGSVKQARNAEIEGVYALKGKIKNTKKLKDLAENKEILEIMSILGLDPSKESIPNYEKIVIAADEDPDGQHIASLIVNFFHKWFPNVIREKRLFKMTTPLVACDYKSERKYFYTMEEFQAFQGVKKLSGVNYLKGLGSLSMEDWIWVIKNKILFSLTEDRATKKYLDIAFGESTLKRKNWLAGKK